jgi:hypothetical protein
MSCHTETVGGVMLVPRFTSDKASFGENLLRAQADFLLLHSSKLSGICRSDLTACNASNDAPETPSAMKMEQDAQIDRYGM